MTPTRFELAPSDLKDRGPKPISLRCHWSGWWDSNPRAPASKAGEGTRSSTPSLNCPPARIQTSTKRLSAARAIVTPQVEAT